MTVNDTDKLLVNRSSSSYYVEQKDLMATLQDTDLMLVNRSSTSYKITGADLKASVVPPAGIVEPTIIAPPDGAGIGGDVTYTPKTSAITNAGIIPAALIYTITAPPVDNTLVYGNAPGFAYATVTTNKVTDVSVGTGTALSISPQWMLLDFGGITGVTIGQLTVTAISTQNLWGTNDPNGPWIFVNEETNTLREVTGTGYRYYAYSRTNTLNNEVQQISTTTMFPLSTYPNTALTFTDANTYNADTGADMDQPISETFTAGQLVTGVKAGSDDAAGTLTADASGNTMTVTPSTSPDFKLGTGIQDNGYYGVTYGGGKFVALGIAGAKQVSYSLDGISWLPATAAGAQQWQAIAYGNGTFVAVATNGFKQVMHSPDGINWTAATAVEETNQWNSVTYGNGKFVAVSTTKNKRAMYSTDNGKTWTEGTGVPAEGWLCVTYGELSSGVKRFVALSSNGNGVMYSDDGIAWTSATAAEPNNWNGITYGNGKFVAVSGDGTNRVMWSTDGISWTKASATAANTWYGVTYGTGKFVAVSGTGTNRVMYSSDAITWYSASAAAANTWYGVTYGAGKFVAVAFSGTTQVMYSPAFGATFVDGMEVVNSTTVTRTAPAADDLEFVGSTPTGNPTGSINTWGNATWEVSTNSGFTSPMVGTKIITPGSNQTLLPAERGAIVLAGGTDYYARLSYNATNPSLPNVTSSTVHFKTSALEDGITYGTSAEKNQWRGMTYGNGKFVAVAIKSGGIGTVFTQYSDDGGLSWTLGSGSPSVSLLSVCFGNGLFVAVGNQPVPQSEQKAIWSSDGINWNGSTGANKTIPFISVAYGGGKFVAVASGTSASDQTMHSTDGKAWTFSPSAGGGNNWQYVTYGDGKFVAVANNSQNPNECTMYSDDGINWTVGSLASAGWLSVTYGNGKFVAVGTTGVGAYSTDGITFTSVTMPSTENYYNVAYGNGRFYAVTSNTPTAISYDGINWEASEKRSGMFRALAFGSGKFVAAESNGLDVLITATGKVASPGAYYNTATDSSITGDELVNRYGIDPTTDNLKRLGIAELTEQPTYAVAGYQAAGDKYQPIEDLNPQLEKIEERNALLRQYVVADLIAEAQALIAQWALEDGTPPEEPSGY